jgi:hypothetical protein
MDDRSEAEIGPGVRTWWFRETRMGRVRRTGRRDRYLWDGEYAKQAK